MEIALKLRKELTRQGMDVILTRDDDYDLSSPDVNRRKKSDFDNRINLINSSKANIYLSIHMNYLNDTKYYGAQVFYTDGNDNLARVMQQSFKDNLKSPREEKKLSEGIYMYKKLKVPGVLIECGFLSNEKERGLLVQDEYQNRIVKTIVDGLLNYY